MTPAVFRLLLLVPFWLAALYGSLQIHQLDLNLGHSICGPWGCGPPTEALIGYHSFWLALIAPGALFSGELLPVQISRKLGYGLLVLGCIGAAGYVGWDSVSYFMKVNSTEYLFQRGFFALVTAVDLPMIQTAVGGCVLLAIFGRANAAKSAVNDPEPVTAQAERQSL